MKLAAGVVAIATLVLAACDGGAEERRDRRGSPGPESAYAYPPAPRVPAGPLEPRVERALTRLVAGALSGGLDPDALEVVAASEDPRVGWLLSDVLRFTPASEAVDALVSTISRVSGVDPRDDPSFADSPWLSVTNHLIAWDLPAAPGYAGRKAELFLAVDPRWRPFFADRDADIDWRLVSWGGVLIDDRPLGDPDPCPRGCIPALDDPALTPAADGDWYPDDRTVFGVVVGGEAVAFPKNIMEVHELVNITVGGRRLGIPYCTLCGSAQAYLLDSVPAGLEPPVLRTSGLLSRSNKVMYDLRTRSVFDTFTGRALSGPLHDEGVVLEQVTVLTSDWGEWKGAHPGTRIVAQDGGIGREYEDDPLGGRDDHGPIFPVGDVDPRLPVQAQVVGVIAPGGVAVAFPAEDARKALADGRDVMAGGVQLTADGGGLRARAVDGRELPAHQAFWFAWSQFHPGTELWGRPAP
ncbi:MAG: DUF3179 domain-containing (seleno)protein [Thermoleophilaceae bacterium]